MVTEYKNQYRINNNILLKLNKTSELLPYRVFENNNDKQYLSNQGDLYKKEEEVNFNTWGFSTYKGYINKVFSSVQIYNDSDFQAENIKSYNGQLLLRQGFDWTNVFGILVVIKKMGNQYNQTILLSRIYTINHFKFDIDNSRELINGEFWVKNVNFIIPNFDEDIMVSCETITFDDISPLDSNLGEIYNYPNNDSNFEPLITSELIPDYVTTKVTINTNGFLTVTPVTLEYNKTLEQSILDYFGLSDKIVPIEITHIIKYGNDTESYKSIQISNEDNTFLPITIGLDITPFQEEILIYVATTFDCNNKKMHRNQSITFNYSDILNPVLSQLILSPETIFPVEVKNETIIQNTVIETKKEKQIIPIYQTIFAEIISEDIIFENKKIAFDFLKKSAYLNIGNKFVLSALTENNVYIFDLNKFIKPESNTTYVILDSEDNSIIRKGNVLITSNP